MIKNKGKEYVCGDMVMVHELAIPIGHSRKFHRPWKGPYRVMKVLGLTGYCIQHSMHPISFQNSLLVNYYNVPLELIVRLRWSV